MSNQDDAEYAPVAQMRDRLNAVSPSFCLAKWKQVTLNLHNGFTQSCHHVTSHKIPMGELATNPTGLHNTSIKAAVRQQMLDGKRPKECGYCWRLEDLGRLSDRHFKSADQWAEPYFNEVMKLGGGDDVIPSSVEVSFESTCNFKCMYCSPTFSSKWAEETLQYGCYPVREGSPSMEGLAAQGRLPLAKNEPNPYIDAFWRWWPELSPKLHDFRITGGEPLLSPHTWRVMENLSQSDNINLDFAINSNMGVTSAAIDRLIQNINRLAGRVRNFTLYTSIDTVGEQAEYIRFGLKYEEYFANVERVLQQVNWPIRVSFMMTVNALSLVGMKELIRRIYELRQKYPQKTIYLDAPILHMPPHMSIQILPAKAAQFVKDCVQFMRSTKGQPGEFGDWEILRVDRVHSAMLKNRLGRKELRRLRIDFYRMFSEYDRRRGTDFMATFPEYRSFYKHCRLLAWMDQPLRMVNLDFFRHRPF